MVPVVALRRVGFEYAAVPGAGIRDIDLEVAPGEMVVLCGPSGSGKSTITKVVNGLAPQFFAGPLSGDVVVAGLDATTAAVWQIAQQVGSVFQDPRTQFFTGDTTSELAFGPENMGWEPVRIRAAIDAVTRQFNLEPLTDRGLLALSGGEQQRLACAVASMAAPAVLVLDEPSSTLDTAAVAGLCAALETWKAAGKAILIAEHRLDYLAGLADRFVYLDGGTIRHTWARDEFLALDPRKWQELGLRAPVGTGLVEPPGVTTGTGAVATWNRPRWQPEPSRVATGTVPVSTGLSPQRVLACRNVRIRRGRRVIVSIDGADLPLDQPLALIGANGSGKSTFVRWLAGVGPRGQGDLRLGGPWKRRQRLERCYLVVQNTNHQLFTESVLQEVLLGARDTDEAAAREILSALDLDRLADRHPLTLSGGEKQRLVIAVAMASGRQLVVLDEPTSGLDATHMRKVADAIATLHARGTAVIVVTHDADLVELTCGAAAHLIDGRVGATWQLDTQGRDRSRAILLPTITVHSREGNHDELDHH